jgi:hypothetical protein
MNDTTRGSDATHEERIITQQLSTSNGTETNLQELNKISFEKVLFILNFFHRSIVTG